MKPTKIINNLILVILCITPLFILPITTSIFVDYFYLPKIFFIYCLVAILAAIWILRRQTNTFKLDLEEKILGVYILLLILSTIFSVNVFRSLWGNPFREEGLFAILAYVFLFIIAKRKYVFSNAHIKFFLLSTSIVALYGISQYFGFDPIPRDSIRIGWSGRAFSTLGNPNFLGSFLTLVLPISTFAYVYTKKSIYLFTASIVYLCLLCTLTRGTWIGAFIGFIILSVYVILYKYSLKHLGVMMLAFLAITILVNTYSNGGVFDRFHSISSDISKVVSKSDDYEKAGAHRIFIWERVVRLIKESPMVGYGLETLDIMYEEKFEDEIIEKFGFLYIADKAHNEYLHIAVSSGIPSLLLYLIFVLSILYKAFQNAKKNPLIIPLLCSVIGYLVQAFFNISIVSVVYVFWIFLGILLSFSIKAAKMSKEKKLQIS